MKFFILSASQGIFLRNTTFANVISFSNSSQGTPGTPPPNNKRQTKSKVSTSLSSSPTKPPSPSQKARPIPRKVKTSSVAGSQPQSNLSAEPLVDPNSVVLFLSCLLLLQEFPDSPMWESNKNLLDLWYHVTRICRENQSTMQKGYIPKELIDFLLTWTDPYSLEEAWALIKKVYAS